MFICNITDKIGNNYGELTTDNIDYNVDRKSLYTMYSEIMHDVKRHGYLEAYNKWTDRYEELIQVADFADKDYCLRAGEAVRYHCSIEAKVPFLQKYILPEDSKWIINAVFLNEKEAIDFDFLEDIKVVASSVKDYFAAYKILFNELDIAI